MSLRKSFSETSAPSVAPICQTFAAHASKSRSCVTPRSSVIASNSVRPGDLRLVLGSPPSRCFTTSVVRFSPETLLTPATYWPSHFTRKLKFLYGSKRCAFTVNCAMDHFLSRLDQALGGLRTGHLLNLNHDELRGLERREADQDIHDAVIDIGLRGGLAVALDEVCLGRGRALEGSLEEKGLHEGTDIQADRGPQR